MESYFSATNRETTEALYRDEDMTTHDQSSRNESSVDESAAYVKVCNICGDAGHKDSLALCSKCKDGAEHIYCMRVSMNILPDSSWMCEECVVLEEKVMIKSAKSVTYERQKSVHRPHQGGKILKVTKVCNICGDAGHKGSLAVCSKCEDGAEHIYCMRVSMDQLPDSGWMCEECVVSEEKVKLKNARSGYSVTSERFKSINQPHRGGKVSKGSGQHTQISVDSMSNKQRHTVMRKRAERETKIGLSLISRDHRPSYLTTKSNHELSSRSRSIQDNEAVPSLSGNFTKSNLFKGLDKRPVVSPLDEVPLNQFSSETHSRKTNSTRSSLIRTVSFNDARSGIQDNEAVPLLSGNFTKSSSFKGLNKRPKVFPLDEIPQNQFSNETRSRKKFSTLSSLGRTVSFNDVSSGRPTAYTAKFQSTALKPFGVADSKRSRIIGQIEGTHTSGHSLGLMTDQMDTSYKELPAFAFPDFDYIWRGEFEIQQSERLPNVLYRIQAHLSTLASPMIPEVVKNLPSVISLEEVSRMDAWPYQFQERDPQDNNIALYFFAQDNVSYANYRSLLHSMTRQDLALRGNISGIEVLIFSSSVLPQGSRYWNGLLFLWGVFGCIKVVEPQIAV